MNYKCTKCGEVKERTKFFKDSQKKTGYRPACKICDMIGSKERQRNNKNRKFNVLKSATVVTKNQYLSLLSDQKDSCAICNKTTADNKRNLSVDHCHNTKLVRGLLCTKCNFGLGYFNDDVELLNKSIQYLKNNSKHKNIKYNEKR